MTNARRNTLWAAAQPSAATDPSSNGSGYSWVPAEEIEFLADEKAPLPTSYQTGRGFPTVPIEGSDASAFGYKTPLIGLPAHADDGEDPDTESPADWLDILLNQFLGTQGTYNGEGVSAAAAGTITADTDVLSEQDLIAVYDAATATAKTQWHQVTDNASAPQYNVAPNFVETPTATAVIYGSRFYRRAPLYNGNNHLAFVYSKDGTVYTLLDAAINSFRITAEAGDRIMCEYGVSVSGSKTEETSTKTALPAAGVTPGATPLKLTYSPVTFNGTPYPTKRVEVDFNISQTVKMAGSGGTGKSGFVQIDIQPVVTIEPLFSDGIENLKRDITTGPLVVQFGAGAVGNGVLNSCALLFPHAFVDGVGDSDDDGLRRQTVTIRAADGGAFGGSATNSDLFRFARA